jgi:hypothetical protein
VVVVEEEEEEEEEGGTEEEVSLGVIKTEIKFHPKVT